jgi:peptide/nickel transport system permease protein
VVALRVLSAIPVLWGVSFLTFILLNLLPGDAASAILGLNATPQELAALRAKLHLNEPFFTRYGHWLGGVLSGHLGASLISGQAVSTILAQRIPVTLELIGYAFVLSLVFAVPFAVLAARRPGGTFDRFSIGLSMLGLSIPQFVLAIVLILVLSVHLNVLPPIAPASLSLNPASNVRYYLMPAISIAFGLFCVYNRLLRADIVEQMQREDYVVFAQAKGIAPWRVLVRHATRDSLFWLSTIIAVNAGTLIGITVIIEQIFALPGIGQELISAIGQKDVPLVEGIVLVFAVVVVAANLVADMLYALLDPRIRYGRRRD